MASGNGPGSRPRLAHRRSWALALPVLYVAVAAGSAGQARPSAWLFIAVALVVALVGSAGADGQPPAVRRARLLTTTATSLALATAALVERAAWAAATREIAAIFAGLAAVRSLGDIEGDHGLAALASEATPGLGPRSLARAGAGAMIASLGSAAILDALAWLGVSRPAPPLAAAAAGLVALAALAATALLTAGARRLELSSPPRALACAAAAGVALLAAVALAIAGPLPSDAAAVLCLALASAAIVRLSREEDALALARRGRRALALTLFGGPVVILAAIAVEGRVPGTGLVAMLIALAAMLMGALASKLEAPLLPAKGRLLGSLAGAARSARDRDTRDAIAQALVTARMASGESAVSPELWMLHPTRLYTVNAAGYLADKDAELPPQLLDLAAGEPCATLRIDVLRALEVRRPDLRSLLRWLEDRGALSATLIAGGEDPDGVLLLPAGARSEPLTLEEVRATKELADAFVTTCQAYGAMERHLRRERALEGRIEALDDELLRLRHASELEVGRHALASSRLARPATIGIYSAASRMAYDALERRIERDAPVVVVARAGVDPVPFIARAHLAGPRKDRPLVIVDGTSSREHDVERWRDEHASPLALADCGLLVLVDGAALPRDIQALVARALAERRPPWERATPLDVAVAFTSTATPDALAEGGRLAPELFARLEGATPVTLPGLRERSEDLFSIVADRLAREGLRVRGRPAGIDAAAFARLVDHPFEGEDAELASIVSRLVAHASGDVVRAADIDALGLAKPPPEQEADPEARKHLRSVD